MTDDPENPAGEPAVSRDEALAAAQGSDEAAIQAELKGAPIKTRFTNLDQVAIEVTEDRAELVLNNTIKQMRQGREWTAPSGLCVGLALSLFTADFKAGPLGITADTMKGMVVLATVLTFVWTVVAVVRALRTPSTEALVKSTIEGLKRRDEAP